MLMRPIVRQLVGLAVAVAAGWLAGIGFAFCWTLVEWLARPAYTPAILLLARPWVVALGSAYFIAPVVPFLVPMYLFIPRSAAVWRWPLCTALGGVAGALIVLAMLSRPGVNPPDDPSLSYLLATIIGGATCLVGALTRERFGAGLSRASNPALQRTRFARR